MSKPSADKELAAAARWGKTEREFPKDLQPSSTPNWNSGGTAGILPAERERATFSSYEMSKAIYGGAEAVKRRRFILRPAVDLGPEKYQMSRGELMKRSIGDFIDIHKSYTERLYRPTRAEISAMNEGAINTGPLMPAFGLGLPTILGQGSPEQIMSWMPKCLMFQMIVGYCQTELSHGSNIRGLQTTSTFCPAQGDKPAHFKIKTPTLGSMKWWNSNVGCVATHALVYAQLLLNNEEKGLHVFLVQLRDENHNVLPGVEAKDVSNKMGDDAIDTGLLRFDDVEVPLEHMCAKRQHIEPDGTYVKHSESTEGAKGREQYLTMMQARAGMVGMAAGKLSIAATIAGRYSLVRHQGFTTAETGASYQSKENAIIEYQVQRYRILKQISVAYALRFSGSWINERIEALSSEANEASSSLEDMPEVHASSSGLKGLGTKLCLDGIEDCREACGGHGYLLNSGVASLFNDYAWQATAEGDYVVLLLQLARFLMKSRTAARNGEKLSGLVSCLEPMKDPNFDPIRSSAPKPARSTDEMKDPKYLLKLFEYRTMIGVARAGQRLDTLRESGVSQEQAWNRSAILLRTSAESHAYFFVLRNFVDMLNSMESSIPANVQAALRKLCALFALSNITDGHQWTGLLDANQVSLVEQAVEELLDDLRPDVCALVDAFDWPDKVLNSTIGRYDGNVYEALYDAARNSTLNTHQPFEGYSEVLRPHLDLDFLKLRNKCDPALKSNL